MASTELCKICEKDEFLGKNKSKKVEMIKCSMCLSVFHSKCLKLEVSTVNNVKDVNWHFYCGSCKESPLLQNNIEPDLTQQFSILLHKQTEQITNIIQDLKKLYSENFSKICEKISDLESEIGKVKEFGREIEELHQKMKEQEEAIKVLSFHSSNPKEVNKPQVCDCRSGKSLSIHNVPVLSSTEDVYDVVASICSTVKLHLIRNHLNRKKGKQKPLK
jgi:hypothetical protein